jgi:hypothetical protein
MAEVLTRFAEPLHTPDGVTYVAQACGTQNGDGMWEGWIEFVPAGGAATPLRSPRETTQPNHADVLYWATGLTSTYLEGALTRALNPIVRKTVAPARAVFDQPAPSITTATDVPPPITHDAVLDPFSVYEKGERILRQQLSALSAWHLVNIIVAYRLSDRPVTQLNTMPAPELAELIVAHVRQHPVVR